MKVLFDEDVPHQLGRELAGHEVSTVQEMRWASVKNGVLLGLAAAAGFEVLLTCDRSMQYQQNVPALRLAVIVLAAPNTKLETIRPLVPEILTLLDSAPKAGTLTVIGGRT